MPSSTAREPPPDAPPWGSSPHPAARGMPSSIPMGPAPHSDGRRRWRRTPPCTWIIADVPDATLGGGNHPINGSDPWLTGSGFIAQPRPPSRRRGESPARLPSTVQVDVEPGAIESDTVVRWAECAGRQVVLLSLIHISEPTRRTPISYAVF